MVMVDAFALGGAGLVLYGVALWSLPASLILGGVGAIVFGGTMFKVIREHDSRQAD